MTCDTGAGCTGGYFDCTTATNIRNRQPLTNRNTNVDGYPGEIDWGVRRVNPVYCLLP